MINFDQEVARSGTASVKHDGCAAYFGTSDVLPLWVADMDFAAPEAVTRALSERAAHPIYGYSFYPDSLYDALLSWLKTRHHWLPERDSLMLVPGVVPSLFAAVQAFTQPNEGVIVQPPVYFPFFSAVETQQRRLIENPLRLENGGYHIDFEHLESCAAQGAKLLLLCSPHNPVGRVWTRAELHEILRIARQFDMTIFSDEIHADLVYADACHTPLMTLANAQDKIITAVAPSKTFNIPGLGLSALIVTHAEQRAALQKVFDSLHISNTNPFSIAAFEAAYRGGGDWLDSLLIYLRGNRDFVAEYLAREMPKIRLTPAQGTFLLWLDCRELHLSDPQLREFFVRQAKVGMNPGTVFGTGGSGFMRMNIAATRHVIAAALERMRHALLLEQV
jgi:cystathionine beta-lyase